jgi:23S rRNA (pseudouridine1915-N3)-methyltransferase
VARLRFLWVGRTRDPDLDHGIRRYLARLRRYAEVEVTAVREPRGAFPEGERLRREGELLRAGLAPRGRRLGLDPAGDAVTSEGLARRLEREMAAGGGQVQFVLGGPCGISPALAADLHGLLSLSPLTLTHEMARLLLVEQVYRACTILRGEPYHR